MRVIAPTSA